jgi:hypothetical protein
MQTEQIVNDLEVNRIVFHFNKSFLTDPKIPMWVVKHKGSTYYVDHVSSSIGFETKETPDNSHTKGSIQFRGKLKIEKQNENTIAFIS